MAKKNSTAKSAKNKTVNQKKATKKLVKQKTNSKANKTASNNNKIKAEPTKIESSVVKTKEKAKTQSKLEVTAKVLNKKTSENQAQTLLDNFREKILPISLPIIIGLVFIALFNGFLFYVIPEQILSQTDVAVAERKKREDEERRKKIEAEREDKQKNLDQQLADENSVLNFEQNQNWTVDMNFRNFGTLKLNLNKEYAPETVDNFIRLVYRDYYNDTKIHRIVKQETFSVIQGGDKEKNDGTGGQSARYIDEELTNNVPDELWVVEPEFSPNPENPELINEPKFRVPDFYRDFNTATGQVTYPKGTILMAKTSEPDSASSQFFISLKDTTLPAQYTVFGIVSEDNFDVIDKIYNEVNAEGGTGDGVPDREIYLETVQIVNPEIEN